MADLAPRNPGAVYLRHYSPGPVHLTFQSVRLSKAPETEEKAGPHDGGDGGSQQEPAVDSTNILRPVQASLKKGESRDSR